MHGMNESCRSVPRISFSGFEFFVLPPPFVRQSSTTDQRPFPWRPNSSPIVFDGLGFEKAESHMVLDAICTTDDLFRQFFVLHDDLLQVVMNKISVRFTSSRRSCYPVKMMEYQTRDKLTKSDQIYQKPNVAWGKPHGLVGRRSRLSSSTGTKCSILARGLRRPTNDVCELDPT